MPTILITGATGFIGGHLAEVFADTGQQVVCAARVPPRGPGSDRFTWISADFTRDFDIDVWKRRIAGMDVVVNAVGILREHGRQTFELLHSRAPRALFAACASAGVKVVQISALGADENARSRYHLSKKAADDALLATTARAVVVQPSLVYGPGGASAALFNTIASLPLIPLPGEGDQHLQPLHIDDLTSAVLAVVQSDRYLGQRIALVGPEPVTLRRYLSELRLLMGLGRGRFMHCPTVIVDAAAQVGQLLGKGMLDVETWQMLQRGNTADVGVTCDLLGRKPRPISAFISRWSVHASRQSALLGWLQLVLRSALAIVWLGAGIVSMGIYPVEDSYVLLSRVGVTGDLAPLALYGAAAMDIVFGVATLFLRHRRWLWIAQTVVIGIYTLVITFFLPEFWLHPFGPLIKNVPILAVIWLLYELEKKQKR